MKKVLIFAIFTILLASFALANLNTNNSYNLNNSDDAVYKDLNESSELLGASCGTVTPGYQNECCIRKGYSGWNEEEFECTGEIERKETKERLLGTNDDKEEKECDAWKCTAWSDCVKWQKTRRCIKTDFNCTTDKEKPKVVKECGEKEQLRFYNKTRDCPEACECSGSTVKCEFENGTRVMTIYAGNSGNIIVQVKNVNMSTNVVLYKNDEGKYYAVLKNNETKEIILPDQVRDKIKKRTRAVFEDEEMNLTEDGYHVQANKKARFLGMIPVKEKVEFNVDPETGEVTKTKTKWWSFLASDVKDYSIENTTEA